VYNGLLLMMMMLVYPGITKEAVTDGRPGKTSGGGLMMLLMMTVARQNAARQDLLLDSDHARLGRKPV
jgi:hypothetical protein